MNLNRNQQYYNESQPGRNDYWRLMAAPRYRVQQVMEEIQRYPKAKTLVDLGCGGGQLLAEISAGNPALQLTGIDMSDQTFAENAKRFPNIRWEKSDLGKAADLGELSGTMDIVVAMEVIEHVDDPVAFLSNARQLARPDTGMVIVTTQSGPVRATEVSVGHLRHFTAQEIQDLFIRAGLSPVKVWNSGFPFHDLSKMAANVRPEKTMSNFSNRPYGFKERAVCAALRQLFKLNSNSRGAQLFAVAQRH